MPFSISRHPGTEHAVIASTKDENYIVGSRILSINDFPTDPITYEEVKSRLVCATYPIVLQLQRPLKDAVVPSLEAILSLDTASGAGDSIVRFNAFKILLSKGIQLVKHNNGNLSQHLTVLRISDKELFYRRRLDPKRSGEAGTEAEEWTKFSLFRLKFVLDGIDSDKVKRKFLNPRHCFELIMDERGVLFELPTPQQLRRLLREEAETERRRKAALSTKKASSSTKLKSSTGQGDDEDEEKDSFCEDESTTLGGGSRSALSDTSAAESLHIAKCRLFVDCLR